MSYGFVIGIFVVIQNMNVVVVSDVFCCFYLFQLIVKKKCKGLSGVKLEVVDFNFNVVFCVDGFYDSFSKKCVFCDFVGYFFFIMCEKVIN